MEHQRMGVGKHRARDPVVCVAGTTSGACLPRTRLGQLCEGHRATAVKLRMVAIRPGEACSSVGVKPSHDVRQSADSRCRADDPQLQLRTRWCNLPARLWSQVLLLTRRRSCNSRTLDYSAPSGAHRSCGGMCALHASKQARSASPRSRSTRCGTINASSAWYSAPSGTSLGVRRALR